jgi:membrane fusion protein, multidrug efflux system
MTASSSRGRGILIALVVVAGIIALLLFVLNREPEPSDDEVQTNVPVHVGTVERGTLHRYVTAYGYVEPEPPRGGRPAAGALLSPLIGGVLSEIDCVEGERVTRGSVLFKLDSRLAEVALQRAQQQLDFAEKAFARQQELLASSGTSQRSFQEAQQQLDAARSDLSAAETQLDYLHITSPLSGTVVRLNATVGQFVEANTVLAEVVDLDRLIVSARVPSRDIEGIRVGQSVSSGTDTTTARGVVTVVGRDVDPKTGTYLVQSSVPRESALRPGQFVDIRIVAETHADVLVVPEVSLVTRAGEGSWIMVVDGDHARRLPVTVGLRDGGHVEVSGEGVSEGMTIVTEDAYSLPEETQIQVLGR